MTRDEYRDKYGPSGRPLPRFCVPKNAGTLEETVRCIDDGKLSGSNYATRMPETIVPPTSEVTRVIRIMREQIEAVRLLVHELGGVLPDAAGWELLPKCSAANCSVLETLAESSASLPE